MIKNIPVHWLSKEARFRIIDLLLSTRTLSKLAEELEVSRSVIKKYVKRETHPSDSVMEKVFQIAQPYEEEGLVKIAINDLVEAIEMLSKSLEEKSYRDYLKTKLSEVLSKIG